MYFINKVSVRPRSPKLSVKSLNLDVERCAAISLRFCIHLANIVSNEGGWLSRFTICQ